LEVGSLYLDGQLLHEALALMGTDQLSLTSL